MLNLIDLYRQNKRTVFSQELTIKTDLKKLGDPLPVDYYTLANQGKTPLDWENLLIKAEQIQLVSQRPVMVHVRAGDVARHNLQSTFWNLQKRELTNFLLVTGDKQVKAGGFSSAMTLLSALLQADIPNLFLATTIDVNRIQQDGLVEVVNLALAKERQGASFLFSQFFCDPDLFLSLQKALIEVGSHLILIAGVWQEPTRRQLAWVENFLGFDLPQSWWTDSTIASQALVEKLLSENIAGIHYFANF